MNKYVNRDDVVVAFGQSLNNMLSRDDGEQIAVSLIKGIPTIEAPTWTPCSERLPKEDGWYLIALLTEHGALYLPAHWYRGRWLNVNEREDAFWIPIPPYTGIEVPTTMAEVIDAIREAEYRGYKQGKEDEHRWWTKLCANCDGAIDEPQPSKILEAYAKGYKDGADAVKGIKGEPQKNCYVCRHLRVCDIRDTTNELCRFERNESQTEVNCDRCKHKGVYSYCHYCDGSGESFEPQTEREGE